MTTLTHYVSLTDALERDMMRNVSGSQSDPLTLAVIAKGIVHGIMVFAEYIAEVNSAMNAAREQNAKYSGAQW